MSGKLYPPHRQYRNSQSEDDKQLLNTLLTMISGPLLFLYNPDCRLLYPVFDISSNGSYEGGGTLSPRSYPILRFARRRPTIRELPPRVRRYARGVSHGIHKSR